MRASLTLLTLSASLLAGCGTFTTTQTDERTNIKTGEKTKITTKVSARTLWDSKNGLTSFKASQTEKTQGASVGSLNQESSGTNTVKALEHLDSILRNVK